MHTMSLPSTLLCTLWSVLVQLQSTVHNSVSSPLSSEGLLRKRLSRRHMCAKLQQLLIDCVRAGSELLVHVPLPHRRSGDRSREEPQQESSHYYHRVTEELRCARHIFFFRSVAEQLFSPLDLRKARHSTSSRA